MEHQVLKERHSGLIQNWNRRETGAPGGSRTPNPQIRSLMLYPLSYGRIRPSFSLIFDSLSTRDACDDVSRIKLVK